MAFLGAFSQSLRIAQAADIHCIGRFDFGSGQTLHKQGLLAEHGLDGLTSLNRASVNFSRAFGQNICRRSHLADQRNQRGDTAHARRTDCRNIDEIAPPNPTFACGDHVGCGSASRVSHQPKPYSIPLP